MQKGNEMIEKENAREIKREKQSESKKKKETGGLGYLGMGGG